MNFNQHYRLKGMHAFLGASNYRWIRYSDEKLKMSYHNNMAVKRGTELHELAERLIKLKVKLPRSNKTLNHYVNDAIGFNMGKLADEYLLGDKVDIVGCLELNKFNGRESVQMNLRDLRKSY